MIQFTNVFMTYPSGNKALQNINLNIDKGEMAYISGRSGAGKSTLLRLINLIDRHTRGQIIVKGQNLEKIKNNRIPIFRRNIGFIFQLYNLIPVLTAFENVELPLFLRSLGKRDRAERVSTALEIVGLGDRMDHFPRQLSGGQEQRVSIARALVSDPTLLVADEPTGDLDRKSGIEILDLIQKLNEDFKKTVIMVTHDPQAAERAGNRVFLEEGKLVSSFSEN